MKRRHSMPFGAECCADGKTRFRLWAPAARQIHLLLNPGPQAAEIALQQSNDGWFEHVASQAGAGTKYQFRLENGLIVPDPASRFQPADVHGPSEVIDPEAFVWLDESWMGRPWEEAVIYEMHVGTFTAEGTFRAAAERLDYLCELGITAIELMPVADFFGRRNWGYDGVLPFAPDNSYGRPEDLKELIQAAHARGIMVLLDVVYNHFGPQGNYLHAYAPQFFTDRHHTPWGQAINFDGPESPTVRDFFIHNALYWVHEYHLDGLRFDAVHAIVDDSSPHILNQLAAEVRNSIGPDRYVHLILENDSNESRYLKRGADCRPKAYAAQWNDDIHHALHVLITNESDGYYSDYSSRPIDHLARCLTQGFAYQGESSLHRGGNNRGESTEGIPTTAFISFLQNHDQIGNRAFGERIQHFASDPAVRAALAVMLLAPAPPMLFMGEEFGSNAPFLFFCDFSGDLAAAVTAGRRGEFARFAAFSDPAARERIPDPNAVETFERCKLDWAAIGQAQHQQWLVFYHRLLKLRRELIAPHLSAACRIRGEAQVHGDRGLTVEWGFPDGSKLTLLGNLGENDLEIPPPATSSLIYSSHQNGIEMLTRGCLPAWSVLWFLK